MLERSAKYKKKRPSPNCRASRVQSAQQALYHSCYISLYTRIKDLVVI